MGSRAGSHTLSTLTLCPEPVGVTAANQAWTLSWVCPMRVLRRQAQTQTGKGDNGERPEFPGLMNTTNPQLRVHTPTQAVTGETHPHRRDHRRATRTKDRPSNDSHVTDTLNSKPRAKSGKADPSCTEGTRHPETTAGRTLAHTEGTCHLEPTAGRTPAYTEGTCHSEPTADRTHPGVRSDASDTVKAVSCQVHWRRP